MFTVVISVLILVILACTLLADDAYGVKEPSMISYSEFVDVQSTDYKNDLPYVAEYVNSLLTGNDTLVVNGMIVLASSLPTDLQFTPSGGSENRLEITPISRYNTIFFNMEGNSGNKTVGFDANNLDYHGQYISLIIGNVTKSRSGQIIFVFDVKGNKGDYTVVFVHGPLKIHGWYNNYYYEKIDSYSSKLINLKDLISFHGDDYSYVDNISVRIQREITTSIEFRIDLNKTTENLPVKTPAGKAYYVIGNIQKYNSVLLDSKYLYHNLGFHKLVDAEYLSESDNFNIVSNGWDVSNVKKWKDNRSGLTNVTLTAERNVEAQDIYTMIYNFDIYNSLLEIGEKDLLLISLILVSIVLYLINTLRPKLIKLVKQDK